MHPSEMQSEPLEANAVCSMLRTATLSPFTTLHDPFHVQQTVAVTEPVFIYNGNSDKGILTLCWAILLAQYGGSTTVELEADVLHRDGRASAGQTIGIDVSRDKDLREQLATIIKKQGQLSEPEKSLATGKEKGTKDVRGFRVSMLLPWHCNAGYQTTNVSGSDWWCSLDEREILRLVVLPLASTNRLACYIRYVEAAGFKEVASRFTNQFAHVVRRILPGAPCLSLQYLDMMSKADKAILEDWTRQSYPPVSACCHHLLRAQAEKQPSAPAVSAWDGELSYADLDSLSGTLATVLASNGVRKGTCVLLLFEKSKWMVVAMLGVLRAGGTCISMCASYPDSYLQRIVRKSGAETILCSRSQAHRFEHLEHTPWIVPEILAKSPCLEDPNVDSDPHDLAHVIFTSGSTGEPKGVLLTHEAIATAAHYHSRALNVQPTSRILQFSSYAFDMSILETWYALTRGGCLCIPSETQRLWELPAFVRNHRASWAFFTPTLLRSYRPENLSSLDTIVLGGEAVTQDLIAQWGKHVRLFNLWGPSEGCGGASCEILPGSWIPGTFGRSACCSLWIVQPDDPERLAAIGTVGEIVIEGDAVAEGYLNDPIRTAEVFIPPPKWRCSFPRPVQGRFYKTGDLAQYNADGTIRYVSRKDTMVKINGQRVDLEAVEIALRRLEPDHEVAVDAVVLQGRSDRSDAVLLAFIENPAGAEWNEDLTTLRWPSQVPASFHSEASRLLERLAKCLPRFMVPLFLVPLTNLPVGPTGKADKKRLRKAVAGMSHTDLVTGLYQRSRPARPAALPSPATQTDSEHRLLEIVAGVLSMDSSTIDMDRSFRELGGDSVSAIQVARHLATHGQSLHIQGLLSPKYSLRQLAISLQAVQQARSVPPRPFSLLHPTDDIAMLRQIATQQCGTADDMIEDMYPCTPIQEGLLSITSGQAVDAYVDRFLFHLPSGTDVENVMRAWDTVVDQVPVLRTRLVHVPAAQARCYQVVVRQPVVWRRYSTIDEFTSADNALAMTFGTPMIRLSCIQGEPRTIAVTLHHAIYDGWTLSLLLRLVEQAYHGVSGFECLPFSLFTQHLQEQRDPTAAADLWRRELANVEPSIFPPYPTPGYVPHATTSIRRVIEPPSGASTTPTVRLRLAWALLLSLYSGTDDVVFGTVVDGRRADLRGIEAVAGPTIATVPVRCLLRPDCTVRDALLQLEEARSRAVPFEHTGLQHIARTGEDGATACRFRSLLVVQFETGSFGFPSVLGSMETRLGGMQGFPGYGLIFICELTRESWALELMADTTLISERQASRMVDQLAHLVFELGREERQLRELSLLCEADRTELSSWNGAILDNPQCCIHEAFAQTAERQPEAPALSAWDGVRLSYSQLDQLASAIAVDLELQHEPAQQSIICILLPRSHWVPVVMLAAMKAGRPFVLLDLEQPVGHHQKICQQVRATLVVTLVHLAARARALMDSIYLVDSHSRQSPTRPIETKTTANDIAYIVFTSGSTGDPKAVVIEHGQFSAAAVAQQRHLTIHDQSRVLHLSSYAFDSFAVEILTTLCAGGCVCIPSDDESRSDLVAAVQRFQATLMIVTPSMLRLVDAREVPSLETVVAVGESLLVDQAEEWSSRVQLLCGYGPTECCTGASAHPIDPTDVDVLNIGRGMGAHLWLVHKDNHDSLVPLGAVGEIVIQGPIVGREYFENQQKTQEAFVETTDWASRVRCAMKNGRFYKTGDLGRYNEDGSVTFLGRHSRQVKLRGQRLDLSMVEHHLQLAFGSGCTAVATLVRPRGDRGHPLLVAMIYMGVDSDAGGECTTTPVFCQHSPSFASRAVQAHMSIQVALPAVMVPSLFLQLRKLPLLASGKVNRPALQRAAEATTPHELAALGQLGSQEVVESLREDETIALTVSRWLTDIVNKRFPPSEGQARSTGGNSILAQNVRPAQLGLDSIDMVMLSQSIMREFNVTVPTSMLFQGMPTVREIAAMISSRQCNGVSHPIAVQTASWWKDYRRLEAAVDRLCPTKISSCKENHGIQPSEQPRPRHVLLTGGTGFLGSRILHSLLVDPNIQSVTLLVRAPTVEGALARIIRSARLANWWRDEYSRVIRVWLADMAQPRLGLSDDHWEALCGQTHEALDAIIHSAATVHWLYDYDALQASNVQSTFELLTALSHRRTPVRFTYVSALRPGEESGISAVEKIRDSVSAETGYSQTKLVSEMLIQRYLQLHGHQGHSFTIVRPGLMMGGTLDGVANVDDVIWRTVSAALDIKGYNSQEDDSWLYISPVDWVASVVVHHTLHRVIPRTTDDKVTLISVEDGLYLKDFWRAVMDATAQSLAPMDGAQWLSLVQEMVQAVGSQHCLSPVIEFAQANAGCIGSLLPVDNADAQRPWHSVQSILWMTVVRNVKYLTSVGFWESAKGTTGQRFTSSRTNPLV